MRNAKKEQTKKVLIVSPEIPLPVRDGGMLRHFQLVRAASARFTCDLVALAEPGWHPASEKYDYLRQELNVRRLDVVTRPRKSKALLAMVGLLTWRPLGLWLYRSSRLALLLERVSSEESYDACLILGDVCMAQYAQHVKVKRMVWDVCDDPVLGYRRRAAATTSLLLRKYYELEAQIIDTYIRKVASGFDSIVVIAEKDGCSLRKLFPNAVTEVPNTVNVIHFHPCPSTNGLHGKILFTGAVRSWANREAVYFFVQHVMPLVRSACGEITFQVVGDGFEHLQLVDAADIVLTGFVKDLAPHYNSCDVFVCPLTSGTGIKNKLLEAMACGCPVVTTTIGAEGLDVSDGRELLIADTAKDFATALQRLLEDPLLRKSMGTNARRFVERGFSQRIAEDALARALTS